MTIYTGEYLHANRPHKIMGMTITHNKVFSANKQLIRYTQDESGFVVTVIKTGKVFSIRHTPDSFYDEVWSIVHYGTTGMVPDYEAEKYVVLTSYDMHHNAVFVAKIGIDTFRYNIDPKAKTVRLSATYLKDARKFPSRAAAEKAMSKTDTGHYQIVGVK